METDQGEVGRAMTDLLKPALQPTPYIDAGAPFIANYARKRAGGGSDHERAVRLYYAVRDDIRYDMFTFRLDPQCFVASTCLQSTATF